MASYVDVMREDIESIKRQLAMVNQRMPSTTYTHMHQQQVWDKGDEDFTDAEILAIMAVLKAFKNI